MFPKMLVDTSYILSLPYSLTINWWCFAPHTLSSQVFLILLLSTNFCVLAFYDALVTFQHFIHSLVLRNLPAYVQITLHSTL